MDTFSPFDLRKIPSMHPTPEQIAAAIIFADSPRAKILAAEVRRLTENEADTQTLRANAVRDQSLIDSLGQRTETAEARLKWLADQPAVSLWAGTLAATGARIHDICAMTLDGGTVLENIGTGPTLAAAIDDAMAREESTTD